MKTQYIKHKLSLCLFTAFLLATMVCCFTVIASADQQVISIQASDLEFGLQTDEASLLYKVYDGSPDVSVTLKKTNAELGIAAEDKVEISATAVYNSQNVNEAKHITVSLALSGENAAKYKLEKTTLDPFGAYIAPKALTWKNGTEHALAIPYNLEGTVYDLEFDLPELEGMVAGDGTQIPKGKVSVQTDKADPTTAHTQLLAVDLGANYTVEPLNVKVTVNPIVITEILWEEDYLFHLGDEEASAISINGVDAAGNEYRLNCVYPENYAKELGEYSITAEPMNSNFVFADSLTEKSRVVTFIASEYKVWMDSAVYVANAGFAQNPTEYMLSVSGDLPPALRAKITYWVGEASFASATNAGVYTVVASLPTDLGCVFLDESGKEVTELKATLTLNRLLVNAGDVNEPYAVIVTTEGGLAPEFTATLTQPELSQKAIKSYGYYKGYKISVSGSANASYTIRIALTDQMFYEGKAPAVTDLYLYDPASGSMKKATEMGKTVTLGEGYYEISNLNGDAEWIFVFASEKTMMFWLTAPGIAIILLLLFAIAILLFFVGLSLIRSRKAIVSAKAEAKPVQEPVKEEPAAPVVPEIPKEKEPEAPEILAAPELVEEEEIAEEPAFEVALEPAIDFEAEIPTADQFAEEIADLAASDLENEVEAEIELPEADFEEVDDAVADAMEETLNASADASNAAELVEEDADEEEEGKRE